MTDETATAGSETGDSVTVQVGQPGQTVPVPAEPATSDPVNIDSMTADELDAIEARIQSTRANRPKSIADQLADIRSQIDGTDEAVSEAVRRRQEAKGDAATLEAKLSELQTTLRKAEIVEAAAAAGFKAPKAVADYLSSSDGDVTQMVAAAAASGAWAMVTPATSAPIGGPSSETPAGQDAGIAGLIAEIESARS